MTQRAKIGLVIIVLAVAGTATAGAVLVQHGVSARDQPTAVEAFVARGLRHLAVPRSTRQEKNPVPVTPAVLAEARAHFADHCASCHGNDGSGQTEIGQHLYPKAPDMRQADTQSLSDGELFSIIHTGSSLACPQLPPDHLEPGSLAPNIGDHGPSDSALAASSGWRLRRPAADRHAARCASRDLCSGARPSAPCALDGVRLTGMPAWGEDPPEEDQDSWKLVHFIRHLPEISHEELTEMKKLNPQSPQEMEEEEEEQQFLQGKDSPTPSPPHHH